jgi:hypothetical protein
MNARAVIEAETPKEFILRFNRYNPGQTILRWTRSKHFSNEGWGLVRRWERDQLYVALCLIPTADVETIEIMLKLLHSGRPLKAYRASANISHGYTEAVIGAVYRLLSKISAKIANGSTGNLFCREWEEFIDDPGMDSGSSLPPS